MHSEPDQETLAAFVEPIQDVPPPLRNVREKGELRVWMRCGTKRVAGTTKIGVDKQRPVFDSRPRLRVLRDRWPVVNSVLPSNALISAGVTDNYSTWTHSARVGLSVLHLGHIATVSRSARDFHYGLTKNGEPDH